MGLFSQIFGSDRPHGLFRSEMQHLTSKVDHTGKNGDKLQALQDQGLSKNTTCDLDLFFITNTDEKAQRLVDELTALGYSSKFADTSGRDPEFVISSRAIGIEMDAKSIAKWTDSLCDLAAKHDSEFCEWLVPETED